MWKGSDRKRRPAKRSEAKERSEAEGLSFRYKLDTHGFVVQLAATHSFRVPLSEVHDRMRWNPKCTLPSFGGFTCEW